MPRLYLQSVWKKYWRVCSHQQFSETVWLGADCPFITERHRTRLTPNSISLLCINCQWRDSLYSFLQLFGQKPHRYSLSKVQTKLDVHVWAGTVCCIFKVFPRIGPFTVKILRDSFVKNSSQPENRKCGSGRPCPLHPVSWPCDSFLDHLPKASHKVCPFVSLLPPMAQLSKYWNLASNPPIRLT